MFPSSLSIPCLLIIYPIVTVMVFGAVAKPYNSSSYNCSEAQLSKCISNDNMNNIGILANEETLDSLCGGDINDRIRCVDTYTKNCMKPGQRSHFNKIYLESTMVIQEFCVDGGEYRKEFLKHSPCLKNSKDFHDTCAANYSRSLQNIMNDASADAGSMSSRVHNLCCSLKQYVKCSKDAARATCGEETARFTGGFLDRMLSGFFEIHCRDMKTHNGQCITAEVEHSLNHSLSINPSSLVLLLCLVSLITKYFWN